MSLWRALLGQGIQLLLRRQVTALPRLTGHAGGVLVAANRHTRRDWLLLADLLPAGSVVVLPEEDQPGPFWRRLLSDLTFVALNPQVGETGERLLPHLKSGGVVVAFPEGAPSSTGAVTRVDPWPVLAAAGAGVPILPVHLDGPQFTPWCQARKSHKRRWLPRVQVAFCEARRIPLPVEGSPHARQVEAQRLLTERMQEAAFLATHHPQTLWEALVAARQRQGSGRVVVSDATGLSVNYDQLFTRAILVGRLLADRVPAGRRLALLLPTSLGGTITFLAAHVLGQAPALLNFTAGARGMLHACRIGQVGLILTSRRFVDKARLEECVRQLEQVAPVLYLEDLRSQVGLGQKLSARLAAFFPRFAPVRRVSPDDPAVILFTSGSEGVPKGVVLSHANLLANIRQFDVRFDLHADDLLLNALPMFHSFGLTVGTLAPLVLGFRCHLHPSPLEYHAIPEAAYGVGATLLAGTDTFLSGYGRAASPVDFIRLRYLFAGAEPLREATRQLWLEKFGLRILEGYGATETSPVLAVNTTDGYRPGSVGRLLPGIQAHLEATPGIAVGGRLWVRGPNVMRGYLSPEGDGGIQSPATARGVGWYDTGDIVAMDREGFVRILGRARRFAKIGGEMISLAAVEEMVARCWPERRHAVVSESDPGKGERLVLLTEEPHAERGALVIQARRDGLPESCIPRRLVGTSAIPLTGAGKTDYPAVLEKVREGMTE